jgi:hypothetical protein
MTILTIWVHDRFAGNTTNTTNTDSCTNDVNKPVLNIFTKWNALLLDKYFK